MRSNCLFSLTIHCDRCFAYAKWCDFPFLLSATNRLTRLFLFTLCRTQTFTPRKGAYSTMSQTITPAVISDEMHQRQAALEEEMTSRAGADHQLWWQKRYWVKEAAIRAASSFEELEHIILI